MLTQLMRQARCAFCSALNVTTLAHFVAKLKYYFLSPHDVQQLRQRHDKQLASMLYDKNQCQQIVPSLALQPSSILCHRDTYRDDLMYEDVQSIVITTYTTFVPCQLVITVLNGGTTGNKTRIAFYFHLMDLLKVTLQTAWKLHR